MKHLLYFIALTISLYSQGQIPNVDSCGVDNDKYLNRNEIAFLDSIFSFYSQKSSLGIKFTTMNDLENKRVTYYDCSRFEEYVLTKMEFFKRTLPRYRGPHGIIELNEMESKKYGYDILIVINCKTITRDTIINYLNSKL